jgi:hypothetical protein
MAEFLKILSTKLGQDGERGTAMEGALQIACSFMGWYGPTII